MKKGIVLEQHRNYTIILTKEGTFQKVRPIKNVEIGMEVPFKPIRLRQGLSNSAAKKRKLPASILAAACIFLLLFVPFTLITGNNQPYAYVAIDINPSIELEITDELTVQSVRPVNSDASVILNQLTDLEDKDIASAIDMIIEKSEEYGMVNNAKHMLVGVSYPDEDSNEQQIREGIEKHLKDKSDWDIASFHVPEDMREEAMELDTSMNEIMAENLDDGNDLSTNQEELDDEERAIIDSFYNNIDNNNHSEKEVPPTSNEEKQSTSDETQVEESEADIEKEETEDDPNRLEQPDERKSEHDKIKTEERRNEQENNKDPGTNIKEDEEQEHRHEAIPSDKQEPNNRPHADDNESNPEQNNKEQGNIEGNTETDEDDSQGNHGDHDHGNDPPHKDNEN